MPSTVLRGLLGALLAVLGALTGSGSAAAQPDLAPRRVPLVGMHVPWAAGGPRILPDGQQVDYPVEWPGYTVPAVRLWDTRTAWLNLEPARGQFDFANLDAHLAAAHEHGTSDVTLVLWGTPGWAARTRSPADAPWLGPGSASPPADLTDWTRYVSAVATRYRGQIGTYEIGNEVNLPMFWRGTPTDLVAMVDAAARAVKAADPAARVLAPSLLITRSEDTQPARRLWSALAAAATPVDALTFHYYPPTGYDLAGIAARMRALAVTSGLSRLPLWVTETNRVNPGAAHAAHQARGMLAQIRRAGANRVTRVYLYAWTRPENARLLPWYAGTPADQVLAGSWPRVRTAASRGSTGGPTPGTR